MEEKLRGAIIGAGTMGRNHANVYANHPCISLELIVDVELEQAKELQEKHGVREISTNTSEALDSNSIDIVSIATPEQYHLEPTKTALNRDCNVILEKPIAASEKDGKMIGDCAAQSDAKLLIGHLLHFEPRYTTLKQQQSQGDLGELLSVQAARIANESVYQSVGDWAHPITYQAVHDIDILHWYTEDRVKRVHAEASEGYAGREVPAAVHGTLLFEGGAVGNLEINWVRKDSYPSARTDEVRLTGTDGSARLHGENSEVQVATDDGFQYPQQSLRNGLAYGPLRWEIDHFINCIRNDEEPEVTWEDGLACIRVAESIIESIEAQEPVYL